MKRRFAQIVLLTAFAALTSAEPCQKIHGRAIFYSGDSYLELWHVGTRHTFFVVDEKSSDLILDAMHYNVGGPLHALFGDFTVCPRQPYVKGHAQEATVTRIENPRVVQVKK